MLAPSLPTIMQRAVGVGRLSAKHGLGRTRIDRLFQEGAAKIRIPQRPDGVFEAILINTAGGLTGGDRMDWQFDISAGSSVTLTTQACEKIYASSEGTAKVATRINVGSGGCLAWLPQETILFNEAQLARSLTVELAEGAEALILEPVAIGRLAMGETSVTGAFSDRWRISQAGRLLHAEDFRIGPNITMLAGERAILNGAGSFATLLLISPRAEALLEPARAIIGPEGGASFWNGKLLARLVDNDAYSLRKRLIPLVNLLNREAALPKCWSL